ncbi:MAG TPA: protein kinase, partial [Vicinamibacteria bacterium]|nr:protein kinase [Vicinamibacteria bacterium]
MTLEAGACVGPYEVISPLGAGGMGEVYRARDPRIGREVAIKILPAAFASNPDRLARFSQEARTAGALNHPNLLVVFDLGTHQDSPYLVTELLEGETLRERMSRGTVPLRKALDWTMQIADGVSAAHEKGVIHRDIKPENVFVSRDDRVKLLDFGLAKLLADDGAFDSEASTNLMRRTDPGSVLGTPGYMSPEQVRGEVVDERSDIFSLGIVLAELVTGSHPFRRPTRAETMTAILQSDVSLPESLSPGLARVVDHMLAKAPVARFQSMRDVAFALQLLSGAGSSGEMTAQPGAQPGARLRSAQPEFLSISYRRGRIGTARFAADGSIVYGAAWEGKPLEVFVSRPGMPEARATGLTNADVLSVSATGELAVSLDRSLLGGWASAGTLARVPIAGGAPRRICENVVDADWEPDGKGFAIVRYAQPSFILECPIGRRLHASTGWLSHVRFSPDGSRLAFIEHPWFGDEAGRPIVVDLEGRTLMDPGTTLNGTSGLAWSPDGDEVWIAGERPPYGRSILGYGNAGGTRVVLSAPGQLSLFDATPGGDLLVSQDTLRREVYAGRRGEDANQNLAWFNWPMLTDLARDGSQVLFEEQRAVSGSYAQIYLRPVAGGPAVHIGDGRARALSPDGQLVAADTGVAGHLELIPTGVGESKLVRCDRFEQTLWWFWFPDGERLLVIGSGKDRSRLCLCVPIDGGEPTPAGPGAFEWPAAIAPDGRRIVAPGADERLMIYETAGGAGTPLPGARPREWPIVWSDDGRFVYVYPRGRTALSIDRIDVATGERREWQAIEPADRAGI